MITLKVFQLISFSIVLLFTACKNSDYVRQEKHLQSLQDNYGFKFYDSLDIFRLKGLNEINYSNINYPFFAIMVDSGGVNIHHYLSDKIIEYSKFHKVKDYYISNQILPEESSGDYFKEIEICYPGRKIIYGYSIYNNFERLEEITFIYSNGVKNRYVNKQNSYQHYNDTINEESLSDLYPTLTKQ